MDANKQRVAIAEACGWTVIGGVLCDPKPETRFGEPTGDVDMNPVGPVPDYLNDLNAMHEAEAALDYRQDMKYPQELIEVLRRSGVLYPDDIVELISATAAQRAEAFLRTLNKWEAE